ncbi:NAD(P)H-dependent oxidoreductase [Halocella sp. SP3-1]|uniref:flavodoxin family protein n=1 Tax=Halocella sp. SP3-1 TaxID=2382161 RepID=UPI000F75DBD5|nr:NAD(P)H-dependent oxidoreductase [Halocella sp. SP3-1]AZO94491.1 flavodoxin [Halocella sp. SP3-1]
MDIIMKNLVLYYSLNGNTDFVAKKLAEKLDADIVMLEPIKDYPKGFVKYIIGGFQSLFKIKVAIKPIEVNLADYDQIVIGSPVWAGSMTPPIRSLLTDKQIEGKNVVLFCTYQGQAGKVFDHIEELIGKNNIIDRFEFKNPLKNMETTIKSIEKWTVNTTG